MSSDLPSIPLPQVALFGDEGAANHNRLGGEYGAPGVQLFVYGRQQGGEEKARCATRRGRRWRPARRLRA
jgi:succinylarginine dihydrolase